VGLASREHEYRSMACPADNCHVGSSRYLRHPPLVPFGPCLHPAGFAAPVDPQSRPGDVGRVAEPLERDLQPRRRPRSRWSGMVVDPLGQLDDGLLVAGPLGRDLGSRRRQGSRLGVELEVKRISDFAFNRGHKKFLPC
jgi:hypothetical protein